MGRPHVLFLWLRGVARPARMVYEAGPPGYGLAGVREQRGSSWSCARPAVRTVPRLIGAAVPTHAVAEIGAPAEIPHQERANQTTRAVCSA